jgi:hypothetical protein
MKTMNKPLKKQIDEHLGYTVAYKLNDCFFDQFAGDIWACIWEKIQKNDITLRSVRGRLYEELQGECE